MFGSTLSLEFAIARHPVIQVGKTNTSNKGIVFEPENNEELQKYLEEKSDGSFRQWHQHTESIVVSPNRFLYLKKPFLKNPISEKVFSIS